MASSGGDGEVYDVVVVGAGIMGSCTAYEAAKRGGGARVLLLERHHFLHHLGSSHGESRTIRSTYPEPYYTSMVCQAVDLWRAAQSDAGYDVYIPTPHLDVGPADEPSLSAAISNNSSHNVPTKILSQPLLSSTFSGAFSLRDNNWIAAVSDIGGVIKPTKAVAMFQSLALRHGAILRDRTEIVDIRRHHNHGLICIVSRDGRQFLTEKCVITAGAWTKKLVKQIAGVELPIEPLHTTVCYWKVRAEWREKVSVDGGFPTFASYGEPYIYGTPSMEFPGLIKIAVHGGKPCDPDDRDWVTIGGTDGGAGEVKTWIEEVIPEAVDASGGPVFVQHCMYSMTPDSDYVIDFVGGEFGKDVVVGGGFSGHGFKLGPVVGRILADLALNGESHGVDLGPFRIHRFVENPQGNSKVG